MDIEPVFELKCSSGYADAYVKKKLYAKYNFLKSLSCDDWLILAENGVKVYDWYNLFMFCESKFANIKSKRINFKNNTYYMINMNLFFVNVLLKVSQKFNTGNKNVLILLENDDIEPLITQKNIKYILYPVKNDITHDIRKLNDNCASYMRDFYESDSNIFINMDPMVKNDDGELLIYEVISIQK